MKIPLALITCLLWPVSLFATAYTISPGTRGNTITVDVSNTSGEILQKLLISIRQKPSWVTITSARIDSLELQHSASCQIHVGFDTEGGLKTGEKGEVQLEILAKGSVVSRKTIALVVRIPETYELSQNYPNPFNPTTTIEYRLPGVSRVSLVVFDVLGRTVSTLVNEQQKADYYKVTFDATHVATGVYFYRLRANDFVQTRKLTLIR